MLATVGREHAMIEVDDLVEEFRTQSQLQADIANRITTLKENGYHDYDMTPLWVGWHTARQRAEAAGKELEAALSK